MPWPLPLALAVKLREVLLPHQGTGRGGLFPGLMIAAGCCSEPDRKPNKSVSTVP